MAEEGYKKDGGMLRVKQSRNAFYQCLGVVEVYPLTFGEKEVVQPIVKDPWVESGGKSCSVVERETTTLVTSRDSCCN